MNVSITDDEIWKCYEFAKKMKGHHNPNMIMERDDREIFQDDFRGKLGEVAFRTYIIQNCPNAKIETEIDYSVTPRRQWDIIDLVVDGKHVSVKAIRGHSEFLLIETKRYDDTGHYSYKNNDGQDVPLDLYVLTRISFEEIFWRDMKYTTIEELKAVKHIEGRNSITFSKSAGIWNRISLIKIPKKNKPSSRTTMYCTKAS